MQIILQFGLQRGAGFWAQGLDLSLGLYQQQPVPGPDPTPQSLDFKNCSWIVFLPCFDLFSAAERWGWTIKREVNVSFTTCDFPAYWLCLCVLAGQGVEGGVGEAWFLGTCGVARQLQLGSGESRLRFEMGNWWHVVREPCVRGLP